MRLRVLLFLCVFGFTCCALAQPQVVGTISAMDKPFLFAYGSWDKKVRIENGRALLQNATPRGGGGVNQNLDLSAHGDASPALRLRVGTANTMRKLTLLLRDASDSAGQWEFALPPASNDFSLIIPLDAAPLKTPNKTEKPAQILDLSKITQWQLIGDWSSEKPMDVEVERILIVAPDAAMHEQRKAIARKALEELEKQRREREELKKKYSQISDRSPVVESVSLVAPDIISVSIRSGRITPGALSQYEAQEGDVKKQNGSSVRLVRVGREIGWLIGKATAHLVTFEQFEGDPLLEFIASEPQNYSIRSQDDAAFAAGIKPVNIYRKSKPIDWAQPGQGFVMRHTVYLKMPQPLSAGKTYSVNLGELNVQTPKIDWKCEPQNIRSESVHVNQIGYRPDDPIKRAFLSVWLGTGGAHKYTQNMQFSLLDDATRKAVYRGNVELAKAASEKELMWKDQNFNFTDVYRMDFGDFRTPGEYRVYVENIGCSYPFEIASDVWEKAFVLQMKGLYNQRSGVELGPPYSDFKKPRDFHPADGEKIYRTKHKAEDGHENPKALVAGSTGELVPDAWGGYHDAGDWNPRRVTHMEVTMAHLELLEMFPEYFGKIKLNIPPLPNIPDALTEALFEIDCFRRLQHANGAMPYGIETPGDPIEGEVSWLQSMDAYVFAPDLHATYFYAGVTARAAKLLGKYNAELAQVYQASALKAMRWGEAEYAKHKAAGTLDKVKWNTKDARNYSALILYDLTGDKQWHDVFLENTVLTDANVKIFQWGKAVQRDAAFLYARLPEKSTDAIMRKNTVSAVEQQAQAALDYAKGNAFNITTPDKGKPMFLGFYSTPDAIELARAHFLTGKSEYLAGAVQACQFAAGANPNNMTYTTGLGANPVKNPLKLDSRRTGQKAPDGITVYGNVDYYNWNAGWITWPLTYHLNRVCTPSAMEWPVPEAYFDIFLFVAQNEFTVDTWARNVYVWGYLAARK